MPTVTSLGIWLYPQSPCPQEKWGGGGGGGGATHISHPSSYWGGGGEGATVHTRQQTNNKKGEEKLQVCMCFHLQ